MAANAEGFTSSEGSKVVEDRRRFRRQTTEDGSSSQGFGLAARVFWGVPNGSNLTWDVLVAIGLSKRKDGKTVL